LIGV